MSMDTAGTRNPLRVGNTVLIRTVTNYFTGRVVELDDQFVVLEQAAWVAETGRFSPALVSGEFREVEPYPDDVMVAVFIGAGVDASDWLHGLPRTMK